MKKAIAILVVCMLVMGCTTVYAAGKTETEKIGDAIQKFFEDLNELITDKIPNTYKDLSPTGTKQTTASPTKGGRYYK